MSTTQATLYDVVPYDSHFFVNSHPNRMVIVAALFGLTPPSPRRARILELGCGCGGNLIPIAQTLPEAHCVGIDLSTRQVAEGRAVIETLGLRNIELQAMSILDVDDDFGQFDYIICHGVYSWVPAEVRDRILSICARNLSPDGVAYISYNVYPGWHFRGMIREMMNYHVRPFADPHMRIQQARALLDFLVRTAGDADDPITRALKDEAKQVEGRSDTYVLHEYLEEVNHPVYFHEFAAHAARMGLQYLGPSRFNAVQEQLPPEAQSLLAHLSSDRVRREQYIDFIQNRMFRQDLLCHAAHRLTSGPSIETLKQLRITSISRPDSEAPDIRSEAVEVFRNYYGDRLSMNHPLHKAVLAYLFEIWPRYATYDEVSAAVASRLAGLIEPEGEGHPRALAEAILQSYLSDMVMLHVHAPEFVLEAGERPRATPLARLQAGSDEGILNAHLLKVFLNDFDRLVLRHLDGTRDRAALVADLADCAPEDVLKVEHDGRPLDDPAQRREALSEALEDSLQRLAHEALLVG